MRIIYGSITLVALLNDFSTDIPDAQKDRGMGEAGFCSLTEKLRDGFDSLPETFMALFNGSL